MKHDQSTVRVISRQVRQVLETCARAGVERVVAADHYGMIFLLADGPEQVGGIVYRDDALKYSGMKTLAGAVNAALLPNEKDQAQPKDHNQPSKT